MNMPETESSRQLSLSADVYDRVESRLPYTEFASVEEYVTYVLEEVLTEVDEVEDEVAVDETQVEDRLKSLGYLDE